MGVSQGAGVTHFCLSVANYLASKEREIVAYIEVGSHSRLLPIVGETWRTEAGQCFCRLHGVDYYPAVSVSEAAALADSRKGYVIFDVTQWTADLPNLLHKSRRKILLGSLKPWCREDYGICIREQIIKNIDKEQMEFFSFCLEREEKIWFLSRFYTPIHDLPLLSDPFSIDRKDFAFLRHVVYG